MDPGRYIQLRRQAARMSPADATAAIGTNAAERAWALAQLRALEAGEPGEYDGLVHDLHVSAAFPFDLDVYRVLREAQRTGEALRLEICASCGGSEPCSTACMTTQTGRDGSGGGT